MRKINTPHQAKKLIKHFGGQRATSRALNVSQPTVFGWLHDKHKISTGTAMAIERVTDGKFKAIKLSQELADFWGSKQ